MYKEYNLCMIKRMKRYTLLWFTLNEKSICPRFGT